MVIILCSEGQATSIPVGSTLLYYACTLVRDDAGSSHFQSFLCPSPLLIFNDSFFFSFNDAAAPASQWIKLEKVSNP